MMSETWEHRLYEKTGASVEARMGDVASRVYKIISDAESRFFTMMVLKGIDVSGAPKLGKYSTTWKRLDPKWVARKRRENLSPKFYSYKGDLETTLQGLKAKTVFGRPVMSLVSRSGTLNVVGNKFTTTAKLGVPALKRRALSSAKLRVSLFPGVQQDLENPRSGDIEGEVFGEDENLLAAKLTNWRGRVQRPLLVPYMKWFSRVFVYNKIKEGL